MQRPPMNKRQAPNLHPLASSDPPLLLPRLTPQNTMITITRFTTSTMRRPPKNTQRALNLHDSVISSRGRHHSECSCLSSPHLSRRQLLAIKRPASSSSTHNTKNPSQEYHHDVNHAKTTDEQTTSSQPRYHNTNHAKIAQGHTTSSSSP
jgi:hypothetical protein